MKLRFFALCAACLLITSCGIFRPDQPKQASAVAAKPTLRLTLLPERVLVAGKPTTLLLKLTNIKERLAVMDDDLEEVHTKKLHLLAIDPTLTDYQHLHPQPTKTPGLYSVSFTPRRGTVYRFFADVTPKATGQQEFDIADIGDFRPGAIDKHETHEAAVGKYHFALSFDMPPVSGGESMGTIHVTDAEGKPVASLEPLMGAYAHIAGFFDDARTVIHVHPMGDEPKAATDRGGPDLTFHLAPTRAGFVKLFVQVIIDGKELFVPFGVTVGKAAE